MSRAPSAVRAQMFLTRDYRDVALARRFTVDVLTRMGFAQPHDAAVLVVSELASNALRHGRGEGRLVLSGSGDRLRIEMGDGLRCTRDDMLRGWGLTLVEMLSERWGVTPREDGKVVWCELRADDTAPGRVKLHYDHGASHTAEAAR